MNKKRQIIYTISGLLLTLVFVICSIIIPKYLLAEEIKAYENKLSSTPESYYIAYKSSLAKNASEKLSALDRIKLISGNWNSVEKKCENNEGFLSEIEAVKLAKSQIEYYYESGVFPYSLNSDFDNWYSWDADLYQYTDSTFNTYTAYAWYITFTKYDNSRSCTVFMSESGTILNAETVYTGFEYSTINTVYLNSKYKDSTTQLLGNNTPIYLTECTENSSVFKNNYPKNNMSNAKINSYILNIKYPYFNGENYIIYQYQNNKVYGIGLTADTPSNNH